MAPHISTDGNLGAMSPMAVQAVHLAKRNVASPATGSKPPSDFNNQGFLALFAILGAGMVITALWFFFWARNGGFRWRNNDWEDYKSTVLRRKGPDGKTLSNATKSTKLGGGSVVHGGSYGVESSVGYTDYTDETSTQAFSEMREVEEGKGHKLGLRGGDGRKKKRRHRDEQTNYNDPELREYRQERPARVGGLNRQADGTYTDYSATEPSELGSNVSGKPLIKEKKSSKDEKKEAKDKERRAKERMRKAKLAEKEAAKNAAAEAKAQKEAEKVAAKKEKADKKKKKTQSEIAPSEPAPSEPAPSEPAMTEVSRYEPPVPRSEALVSRPEASVSAPRRAPPSNAYSFTTGDDTATVYTGVYTDNRTAPSEAQESSYYSDYRPNAEPSTYSKSRSRHQSRERRQSRSGHSSPRKQRTSRQTAPSDIFTQTNGDTQGNMSYPCHIPGLSVAGTVVPGESVSQIGAPSGARRGRDVMAGYRRGGVRTVNRRDSLSDSDS